MSKELGPVQLDVPTPSLSSGTPAKTRGGTGPLAHLRRDREPLDELVHDTGEHGLHGRGIWLGQDRTYEFREELLRYLLHLS